MEDFVFHMPYGVNLCMLPSLNKSYLFYLSITFLYDFFTTANSWIMPLYLKGQVSIMIREKLSQFRHRRNKVNSQEIKYQFSTLVQNLYMSSTI